MKVNFLHTLNITVAKLQDAVRSVVQFFFTFNLILNALLAYVYRSDLLINKKKQWVFHLVIFHLQSTYLLKLTVCLHFSSAPL